MLALQLLANDVRVPVVAEKAFPKPIVQAVKRRSTSRLAIRHHAAFAKVATNRIARATELLRNPFRSPAKLMQSQPLLKPLPPTASPRLALFSTRRASIEIQHSSTDPLKNEGSVLQFVGGSISHFARHPPLTTAGTGAQLGRSRTRARSLTLHSICSGLRVALFDPSPDADKNTSPQRSKADLANHNLGRGPSSRPGAEKRPRASLAEFPTSLANVPYVSALFVFDVAEAGRVGHGSSLRVPNNHLQRQHDQPMMARSPLLDSEKRAAQANASPLPAAGSGLDVPECVGHRL